MYWKCLPQHESMRRRGLLVVDPDLLGLMCKIVHLSVRKLHALLHRQQICTFLCLSGEPKPTTSDESATYFLLATTVVVAFVILVSGDQVVQLWVGGLVGNVAGDPFLDPLQYHVIIILPSHGGTIYPQEDVVVWCSPGLVLLLEKVVSNTFPFRITVQKKSEKISSTLRWDPQYTTSQSGSCHSRCSPF